MYYYKRKQQSRDIEKRQTKMKNVDDHDQQTVGKTAKRLNENHERIQRGDKGSGPPPEKSQNYRVS